MGSRWSTRRAAGRERRGLLLMVTPYLIGLVVLILLPFLVTLAMAFSEYDLVRPPTWIGGKNFADLAGDPAFRAALTNSLVFAAVAVPARLVIALGLALLLHTRAPGTGACGSAAIMRKSFCDSMWRMASSIAASQLPPST